MIRLVIVNSKPGQGYDDSLLRDRRRPIRVLLVKSLLIAWLLASILFAHGCHGNEDHELFAATAEVIAAEN
jgi:hypothetical protein